MITVDEQQAYGILESTITIGDTIKEKRFDDNAKQFNCSWTCLSRVGFTVFFQGDAFELSLVFKIVVEDAQRVSAVHLIGSARAFLLHSRIA